MITEPSGDKVGEIDHPAFVDDLQSSDTVLSPTRYALRPEFVRAPKTIPSSDMAGTTAPDADG
jgi:hypothetical protein